MEEKSLHSHQHILESKLDSCEGLAALFANEALAVPRLALEGHASASESLQAVQSTLFLISLVILRFVLRMKFRI